MTVFYDDGVGSVRSYGKGEKKMKKLMIVLCTIWMTLNTGVANVFAEEEPPVAPTTEGMDIEEANALIEEYNAEVDVYNEMMEQAYEEELEAVAEHNALEDEKVAENQKKIETYEKSQQRISNHENKGIVENRTDDPNALPDDYDSAIKSGTLVTIKVEEAAEEDKANKTVKIVNLHVFFDENCTYNAYIPNDISDLKNNEDIMNHLALAEWETAEVDLNDTVTLISESESMGYKSAAFYKWFEGYTNGYWMPSYTTFSSTAVDSYNDWYKGVAQTVSYANGTTDGRAPVDVFSLYAYTFVRTGEEPSYVETYTPDYKEAPEAPEKLEKMELLEAKEVKKVVKEEKEPEAPQITTPEAEPEIIFTETPAPKAEPVITVKAVEEKVEEEYVTTELAMVETVELRDEPTALAAPETEHRSGWALVNLLAVIATIITMLISVISYFRSDEDEEGNKAKFLTVIPVLFAVLTFIFTENIRLPMMLIDRWTILMLVIMIINILLALFIRNGEKEEEKDDNMATV